MSEPSSLLGGKGKPSLRPGRRGSGPAGSMCRLRNFITHVPAGVGAQSSVVHVFSNGSNSASSWSRSW